MGSPSASHLKLLRCRVPAPMRSVSRSLWHRGMQLLRRHEIGIAEYVLSAMLEWTIGLRRMDPRFRQGDWTGSYLCGPFHGDFSAARPNGHCQLRPHRP
jgi:hypothetical protein